jgi:CHAT domain-containing protein
MVAKAQTALDTATKQLSDARIEASAARAALDKAFEELKKSEKRAFDEPIAMAQARKSLPPGVLYAAFSSSEKETYAFLVQASGAVQAYRIPISRNDLEQRVSAFRQLVSRPNSDLNEIARTGRALFTLLFPAEARAPEALGRASHIIISPDGPLWDLPFAALVVNETGSPSYLGLQKPLAFAQSLTIYSLFGVQATQSKTELAATAHKQVALVIGDPVFDRQGGAASTGQTSDRPLERSYVWGGKTPPARLPNTRTEATKIAALYGGAPLLGEGATEASVRQKLESADVIHLATHGYMNPDNPMASGILLTVPLKDAATGVSKSNDGALQAWEIFSQLHLHADLAVLSACETGIGKKVHGEGVIGLTRSLQYAGVRSIVASQWKVGDASTSDLMVAFHTKRQSGQAKDEALRQAMQSVQAHKETAHPYHWASFFLTGDPGKSTAAAGR